jgi:hypothetical protein
LKKIIGILICLLLIFGANLSIAKTINSSETDKTNIPFDLEVTVSGGFGVSVIVKNVGEVEYEYIPWAIDIEGFILLGSSTEGTIELLRPGDEIVITSDLVIGFGLGTITVLMDDIDPCIGNAFIIGPFILGYNEDI